jgi:predicted HTH domain antitoxin
MKSIVLNLPDTEALSTLDVSVYLASKLYADGILSAGQAAVVANLSKRAFIEIMGKYGVSLFSDKEEDLLEDIANSLNIQHNEHLIQNPIPNEY